MHRQRYELLKFFFCDDHAVSDADELQEEINQKLRAYSNKFADKDQFLLKLFFKKHQTPDKDFFQKIWSFFDLKQESLATRFKRAVVLRVIEIATRVKTAVIDGCTIVRNMFLSQKSEQETLQEQALLRTSSFARSIPSYLQGPVQARIGVQIF
jgi:hypothetical protein